MRDSERIKTYKNKSRITNNGCWIYLGMKHKDGYGYVRYKNKLTLLHRLSAHYFLDFDLDLDKLICHKPLICFSKACWNPDHLYVGTEKSNTNDQLITGTHNQASKTHCKRGHEYTKENTYTYRKDQRVCKECQRIKNSINNRYSRNRRYNEW